MKSQEMTKFENPNPDASRKETSNSSNHSKCSSTQDDWSVLPKTITMRVFGVLQWYHL